MTWQPISEVDILDMLDKAISSMNLHQERLWRMVRIRPEKWIERSQGELGGGFWAVALFGHTVVWYNDIEDGFNLSAYREYGTIAEYFANQDELVHILERLLQGISAKDV